MILSGEAIRKARKRGEITIEPFSDSLLNPNSYNFCLSNKVLRIVSNTESPQLYEEIELPADGLCLQPGTLYIGATYEIIGSTKYVMTLLGRSSLGRLGLFLNKTADLGHVGSVSQWTLELSVVQPLRVYPYMRVGQVSFWKKFGSAKSYQGRYNKDLGPVPNRDNSLLS